MKMINLLEDIKNNLEQKHINRQYAYEIVFYIKGRYYTIKSIEFDFLRYDWNFNLKEIQSANHIFDIKNTTRLSDLLRKYNAYNNRYPSLLNKHVNFIYDGYGYHYSINMGNLRVQFMRTDESNSQIIFYFE